MCIRDRAVLIAYLVVRRRNALTNVVDILSMIPYIVPGTVLGIALLIGFNKPPLLISGTMLIMVVALIIRRLPYTCLLYTSTGARVRPPDAPPNRMGR